MKQPSGLSEIRIMPGTAEISKLANSSFLVLELDGNTDNARNAAEPGSLLQNPASVPGRYGEAFEFSGVGGQSVVIPSAVNNANFNFRYDESFAAFIWFKRPLASVCATKNAETNEVIIARVGRDGASYSAWWFGCLGEDNQMAVRFLYGDNPSGSPVLDVRGGVGYQLNDGEWHHGGWVYDGASKRLSLYIDGMRINSTDAVIGFDAPSNMFFADGSSNGPKADISPVCIGSHGPGDVTTCGSYQFDGVVDEAILFKNSILTDADVKTLFRVNAPIKNFLQ
jgi:hypothetical protein